MVIKDKSSAIKYFLIEKVGLSGAFVSVFVIFVFLVFHRYGTDESLSLSNIRHTRFDKDAELARKRNPNCSFYDCFNVYRCGSHLSIYVYPLTEFSDENGSTSLTKEFYRILQTLVKSPYYTSNPNEACIFVPSIDTLNNNLIDSKLISKALSSLP